MVRSGAWAMPGNGVRGHLRQGEADLLGPRSVSMRMQRPAPKPARKPDANSDALNSPPSSGWPRVKKSRPGSPSGLTHLQSPGKRPGGVGSYCLSAARDLLRLISQHLELAA